MNCREVERHGFDVQAAGLDEGQQAAFSQHLQTCDACRQASERIRAALDAWRSTSTAAPLPDVSREWQAVRRRRTMGSAAGVGRPHRSPLLTWLAIPLGAAAALVIAMFLIPHRPPTSPGDAAREALARVPPADESATAPTVVFIDEKSGWLVVWASDQADRI